MTPAMLNSILFALFAGFVGYVLGRHAGWRAGYRDGEQDFKIVPKWPPPDDVPRGFVPYRPEPGYASAHPLRWDDLGTGGSGPSTGVPDRTLVSDLEPVAKTTQPTGGPTRSADER